MKNITSVGIKSCLYMIFCLHFVDKMIALKKATQPIWKLEKLVRVLNSSITFIEDDDAAAAAAAARRPLFSIATASLARFTQQSAIEVFANGPQ